jgi:hypothetical protein
LSTAPYTLSYQFAPGFDHRFRKTKKCTCPLRSRTRSNHTQGHETSRGNQEATRTCFLEKQVSCSLATVSHMLKQSFALRMAASREKQRAHRKKTLDAAKSSVKLIEPMSVESLESAKVREKIKVHTKTRIALVHGEGRSMGMDID